MPSRTSVGGLNKPGEHHHHNYNQPHPQQHHLTNTIPNTTPTIINIFPQSLSLSSLAPFQNHSQSSYQHQHPYPIIIIIISSSSSSNSNDSIINLSHRKSDLET
ncbi:unnamed protein product [Protopolystoma xenopodis]|uniref:Uncharacterized protein n=1 Tax=Protopolystoma xenopodis TaxID=117903 RepID=A0A3S5CPG3_9PLAT|nr:unnamed protein product [Protopolystoma xenopodis]